MNNNGASESHQNNNLKALISFAHFLGPNVIFYDIKQSDMNPYYRIKCNKCNMLGDRYHLYRVL
ncbi:hypothetical protein NVV43_28075, partial [Escherichia marmotae]|nr:hypothetical protein [Escherichia marmotae]